MRLTEIQFKTFRSFVNVGLSLDSPRVLIGGTNGTGKSSIRDAILWALTGETPDMSGKGSGGELLVPDFVGVPDVTASVVVDGIGRVERQWTPAGQALRVTGFTGNMQAQQQALYDKIGTSEGFLRVVLDARAFLKLEHVEAKRLLLALLNVQIQIAEPHPDGTETVKSYTLDEIEYDYKNAFDARKAAKIVAKNTIVPALPETKTYHPKAHYEARMAELRTQLAAQQQAIGETVGRRKALQKQQEDLGGDIVFPSQRPEALEPKIVELDERLSLMDDPPPVVPVPLTGTVVNVAVLKNRREALLAHVPASGCVLDPTVRCDTPKAQFSKAVKGVEAAIAEHPQDRPAVPVVDPRKALREELAGLQQALTAWNSASSAQARQVEAREKVAAELSSLPDTSEQEAAIAATQASITKGIGVMADRDAYEKAQQAHQVALAAKRLADDDVTRLESLCEVLGPSGARVGALTSALGAFEAQVNPFLAPFGWELKMQAEPWGVKVNGRQAQTYSVSERYRIGVALQMALAKLSGLSFAVVDELDVLDAANRKIVGQMLATSALDQVIIISTREPTTPLPNTTGMLAYRLGMQERRSIVMEGHRHEHRHGSRQEPSVGRADPRRTPRGASAVGDVVSG